MMGEKEIEMAQAERRSRHKRSPRQVLGLGGIGREGGFTDQVRRGKWRSRTKKGDGVRVKGRQTIIRGRKRLLYLMSRYIIYGPRDLKRVFGSWINKIE